LIEEVLNPHSKWSDYIKILPKKFELPMFYTIEQLEGLKGLSIMHDCIKDIFLSLREFYHLEEITQKFNLLAPNALTFSLS
jgi:hypothetical protein